VPVNTTNQQITIPIGTDAANNPQAFIDMIADVENRLVQRYTNLADRTARNPAPTQGELSILNTSTWYDRWTGSKWIPVSPIQVVKTASQNVISSTVLVNDAQLLLPLPAANTTYSVEGIIYYIAGTTGDVKFTFTGPAGMTGTLGGVGLSTASAGASGDGLFAAVGLPATVAFGGAGAGVALTANLEATVITVGTTGTLQLQWAQNAVEAVNTTVLLHSRLCARAIS
jgi:hypothetical protein